jgi:predicted transposase YdaD
MFGLQGIRKSKVWQEAYQMGFQEGLEVRQEAIEKGKGRLFKVAS